MVVILKENFIPRCFTLPLIYCRIHQCHETPGICEKILREDLLDKLILGGREAKRYRILCKEKDDRSSSTDAKITFSISFMHS